MKRSGTLLSTEAFTFVELLVASAILVVMMSFLLVVADQTARIWSGASAKVEQFREARTGFERVTTRLAQATLNTYWDYDYNTASPPVPVRYARRSELRFIAGSASDLLGASGSATRVTHAVFFNAPLGVTGSADYSGLANALNTLGYFAEFSDDAGQRPQFINDAGIPVRWRFRLMEFSQPTESFSTYRFTSGTPAAPNRASTYAGTDWFRDDVNGTTVPKRVVAENVIAFIVTPRLAKAEELPLQTNATHSPLAPDFSYDSTRTHTNPLLNPKNQLPPVVQLTMVAIDDKSAEKLDLDSTKADVFEIGKSNLFTNTENVAGDLATLEATLAGLRVRHRIFTTNIHIRAAKWSREQIN